MSFAVTTETPVVHYERSRVEEKETQKEGEVLRQKGKLSFTFKPKKIASSVFNGVWQATITTTDKQILKGPTVNPLYPPLSFSIFVKGPILSGIYSVNVKNITIQEQGKDGLNRVSMDKMVSKRVIVTNSWNDESKNITLSQVQKDPFISSQARKDLYTLTGSMKLTS